jgi:hypothetical protein
LAGRPELIYKQYLAEKEAWLTTHPTVRPSNYREKRGLESYSPRYCKEQSRYLPDHRIDLETETILKGRPHWTTEEVEAWLDNEALDTQVVEQQVAVWALVHYQLHYLTILDVHHLENMI